MIGSPSNPELVIIVTIVGILWLIWIRVDTVPTKRRWLRILFLAAVLLAGVVISVASWFVLTLVF